MSDAPGQDEVPPELDAELETDLDTEDARAEADLDVLREILVGTGHLEIETVKQRLDDPEQRAREVADVLARAIVIRSTEDAQLAAAMRPTIEDTLEESVRKNPQAIVDVIFPIIGPAIRKAITSSINTMVGSMNRTVESAFTLRGLKWRMTAWRSGRSYAEVALAHNLVYRVEQVFLMHRGDGLLVSHVNFSGESTEEPEVISGMLTAIRDFVHDSLRVEEDSSIEAFRVGDLNLMVAPGPHAVLAAVVRGSPPPTLRENLQEAVERVHASFQAPLQAFEGDTEQFAGVEPLLESCLSEERKTARPRSASSYIFWAAIVGGVFALLAWWVMATLDANEREAAWSSYLAALRAEPGYVLTHTSDADDDLAVHGLRDPQARPPTELLGDLPLARGELTLRFAPYHSSHAPFVVARVRKALDPLPTVVLTLGDGVLRVTGRCSLAFHDRLRDVASLVAGVVRVETSGLRVGGQLDAFTTALDEVRGWHWTPPKAAQMQDALDGADAPLKTLMERAKVAELLVSVRVVLHGGGAAEEQLANDLFERLKARSLPVVGWRRGEGGQTDGPAYIALVATVRDGESPR